MANNYGILFLNKALQSEDPNVFVRYGIDEDSFISREEKKAYKFISEYQEKNNQLPSYAMVTDAVESFVYVPNVTDNFSTLADGIKDRRLSIAFNEVFSKEFPKLKEEYSETSDIIEHLVDKLNNAKDKYTNTERVGSDMKQGVDEFIREYKKRQVGESYTVWNSFLPYINDEVGGYSSGNMYVVYGRSGRGKSAITLREALEIAQQGANVLIWSLEMPTFEVLTRLYTMLSAKLGLTTLTIDGQTHTAGFDSSQIRSGQMNKDYEDKLVEMLKHINEHVDGNIIIRGVDDIDFRRRDVKQLESDIENTGADVVIVDPMYYMSYEKNTSKTAGGDASETSKALRRLAGLKNIALIVMTQAEEDEKQVANEQRELKLPTRAEVKKTKSLLEDASTLIAVDTDYTQQRGIVGIQKGRHGGEGTSCEIVFLAKYGVVEELQVDSSMFDF